VKIAVGSESPLKFLAVREAALALGIDAEIVACAARSDVPPQPYGRLETLFGAFRRADGARAAHPGAYAVGIENGLVPDGARTCDIAYVAVVAPDGRRFSRASSAVAVPEELVHASFVSGRNATAGALEAARSGCDPADPHRVWSGGTTDRKTLLIEALKEALLAATRTEEGEAR